MVSQLPVRIASSLPSSLQTPQRVVCIDSEDAAEILHEFLPTMHEVLVKEDMDILPAKQGGIEAGNPVIEEPVDGTVADEVCTVIHPAIERHIASEIAAGHMTKISPMVRIPGGDCRQLVPHDHQNPRVRHEPVQSLCAQSRSAARHDVLVGIEKSLTLSQGEKTVEQSPGLLEAEVDIVIGHKGVYDVPIIFISFPVFAHVNQSTAVGKNLSLQGRGTTFVRSNVNNLVYHLCSRTCSIDPYPPAAASIEIV